MMELEPNVVNGFDRYPHGVNASRHDRIVRGEYDRKRFVLRLAPEVHEALSLSDIAPGEIDYRTCDLKTAQAFSTYLHETIHWWQHIGSFAGFIQSNTFTSQAHLNHEKLKAVLKFYGPKKSIYRLLEIESLKPDVPIMRTLNVIVNNFKDIEFFVLAIQNPHNLEIIARDKFFEGRGHSAIIAYSALISSLSNFDPNFIGLPNPSSWEDELGRLKSSQTMEFYYESPVRRPPTGLYALFEGQARFAQMQYLYICSGNSLTWSDFEAAGMLGDEYVEAFDWFLKITESDFPENVLSPEVGLFLLICDLSINPTDGFPLAIRSMPRLLEDIDPGTRFFRICKAASADRTLFKRVVRYSKDEYLDISSDLCRKSGLTNPILAFEEVASWENKIPEMAKVIEEGKTFEFSDENMALRLIFAKFLLFCKDKYSFPDFFCWPGARMSTANPHEFGPKLFQDHQSLFTDRSDKRGIYPRIFTHIDPNKCLDVLNRFYAWNVLYDLEKQWIGESGVFQFSLDWLGEGSNEDQFQWANNVLFDAFGVRHEDFEIL